MTTTGRWYGELPEAWTESRVGWLVNLVNGYPFASELFADEGIPLVRIRDLGGSNSEIHYAGDFVDAAAIKPGDVLIGMDGDFNVGRWHGRLPALLNQRVCLLRGDDYTTRYLEYVLPLPLKRINDLTYATTVKHLSSGQVFRTWVPVPESDVELRYIVEFLDRETAQIDAMVDAQERLVALLEERARALLADAVAGRLNKESETRPSGLRWAGEIPEHWEVGNIRRFAAMKTGHTPSRQNAEYWENCTIPWFTLADVWQLRQGRTHISEASQQISELGLANSAAELLPAGTVMLSRTASVGFSGIMTEPMATSQDYWNWVCGPELAPEYLLYTFRAAFDDLRSLTAGSTHKTIYEADAAGLRIVVPPLDEQNRIVRYLSEHLERMNAMIAKARESIELMKERRVALISAAVTGRIDVRTGIEQVERDLEEARA